ncbi:sensor histidine kinase [Diaminobutyricibacter sp. McL0618]|uniref:sensor histidine kinase n=1 Tax=Leifsonia sp. McL0618 TaxID=3415677 RepID=UPI003CF1F983
MSATAAGHTLLSVRPRLTIRARLTLTYAGLVTGCGTVLIAVVYVFMRWVPRYAIVSSAPTVSGLVTPAPSATHGTPATAAPAEQIAGGFDPLAVTSASDFLNVLLTISIIALVMLALLSALIGWIVAGRVLKPLKAINEAATIAATGSLDHRVGLQGPHDEIRDLSDTFDRMLGTLGDSFDAHRRFAANASHELRTPLATTQTMIDVTLADPDADAETLRTLAHRIHVINRANMRTVESLLDLADIGQRTLTYEPVDLAELVAEVTESFAPAADMRRITLRVHPAFPASPDPIVTGDPVLLLQCIGNLLQNAIRHNHDGGTVDIHVRPKEATVQLSVANTGEPIPDDIVETLTEPFVRGAGRTTARGRDHGRGLGLAIVASVASALDGSLHLQANPDGGLTAQLQLPRTAENPSPRLRSRGERSGAQRRSEPR